MTTAPPLVASLGGEASPIPSRGGTGVVPTQSRNATIETNRFSRQRVWTPSSASPCSRQNRGRRSRDVGLHPRAWTSVPGSDTANVVDRPWHRDGIRIRDSGRNTPSVVDDADVLIVPLGIAAGEAVRRVLVRVLHDVEECVPVPIVVTTAVRVLDGVQVRLRDRPRPDPSGSRRSGRTGTGISQSNPAGSDRRPPCRRTTC